MSGVGAPLKDPGQRRRYNQPARGEWVDLQPLVKPVLPPWKKGWSIPKYVWDLWRQDSVTGQWSPADHAEALELAASYYNLKDEERRRIKTSLGLNAQGRRNLRWRNVAETKSAKEADAKVKEIRRLRVVGAEHTKDDASP
jgi:hypothetical protein